VERIELNHKIVETIAESADVGRVRISAMFSLVTAMAAGITIFAGQTKPAAPAPLTVLRIAAGPHGEVRNNDFVLQEERTRFDPSHDKQVVVLFQWQGEPGTHRMIAQWKGPDGSSLTTSPVQYEAKDRRFGAYWSLALSPTSATGTWSIEATVDGQPGGRFTFEVAPGSGGTAAPPPTRRILPQAELFTRVGATFAVLERGTAGGERLDPAGAFVAGRGRLFTSLSAVDGADTITAVLPDGTRQAITAMIAMNRPQDWIVLAGGPTAEVSQPIASDTASQVGDRLFSMEASAGASRVLVDGQVTGRAGAPTTGPRLIMTLGGGGTPPGMPVFSEFGELVGLVGGSLVSGTTDLSDLFRFRAELRGVPVVPISLVRAPLDAAPTSLADGRARGDLIPAVQGRQHVLSAGFARGITRNETITPADQRQDFSVRDKEFVVFLTWAAQKRIRGAVVLRMYDEANRITLDTKPGKLDVRPGDRKMVNWRLTVPQRPGMYRAEVLVDGVPHWRGFVRITE
jgi:hypothetical protein